MVGNCLCESTHPVAIVRGEGPIGAGSPPLSLDAMIVAPDSLGQMEPRHDLESGVHPSVRRGYLRHVIGCDWATPIHSLFDCGRAGGLTMFGHPETDIQPFHYK